MLLRARSVILKGMKNDISQSVSLLSRIHSATQDFLSAKLAEKGLPNFASSHGFILFQLSLAETTPMTLLAEKINRDKSTATVLVRRLEKDGFVKIVKSPDDARSKLVALTAKGKNYNEATAALSKELLKTFYRGFTKEEQTEMYGFLSRVAENFKA